MSLPDDYWSTGVEWERHNDEMTFSGPGHFGRVMVDGNLVRFDFDGHYGGGAAFPASAMVEALRIAGYLVSAGVSVQDAVDEMSAAAMLRARGYLIHAPGAETDRARSEQRLGELALAAYEHGQLTLHGGAEELATALDMSPSDRIEECGRALDRARSDAEIARLVIYARREGESRPANTDDVLARLEEILDARIAAEDAS